MAVLCSFILVQHPVYTGLNFSPLLANDARERLMKQELEFCQVFQQCKLPPCRALAGCLLPRSIISPLLIHEMMK